MSIKFNCKDINKNNDIVNIIKSTLFIKKFNSDNYIKNYVILNNDPKQILIPFSVGKNKIVPLLSQNDKEYSNTKISFKGTLRNYQIPIQENIYQQLLKHQTCVVNLRTAFGKTILAAELACRLKLKVVVIVHLKTLLIQWVNCFSKYVEGNCIVVEKKTKNFNSDILICMIERVKYIPKNILEDIGFVIIDEVHELCTENRIHNILQFQPKYIIAETATFEKDNGLHILIEHICGNHIVEVKNNIPYIIHPIYTKTIGKKEINHKNDRLNWSLLLKSITYNEIRNQLVINQVKKVMDDNNNNKIIIIDYYVDHIKSLSNELNEIGYKTDYLEQSKVTYDKSPILIGTLSKIGTGFDVSTYCNDATFTFNILFIITPVKKKYKLIQLIGRILRSPNPIVYFFVDQQDNILKNHWEISKNIMIENCGIIKEN